MNPTSWTKFDSNPGFGLNGLETFDVDLDGKPDIVTPRHWMKNPGSPRQGNWAAHVFNVTRDSFSEIAHADINKDLRRDIVMTVSENGSGPVSWFENPVDPTASSLWVEHAISSDNVDSAHSVWVTDVDLDGNQDVVTSEFRTLDRFLVYYGNSDGSVFTTQVVSTPGVHSGAIGDYDNDGDIDYFGTTVFGTGPILVFRNDLQSPAVGVPSVTPLGVASLGTLIGLAGYRALKFSG